MLPTVKFLNVKEIYAIGIGVKPENAGWQYYLPFKSGGSADNPVRGTTTDFALALSDTRVVIATRNGDVALIDLDAEQVIARAKTTSEGMRDLQASADGRYLFAQGTYHLHVLDAKTLAVIQFWHWIERTGDGWMRYIADDAPDIERRKLDDGTLVRLGFSKPVYQIDDRKLAAPFGDIHLRPGVYEAEGPGSCVMDIVTGAIELHDDVDAAFRLRRGIWALSGPVLAQTDPGWSAQSESPAPFDDFVAREISTTIVATGDKREATIAALNDLAGKMEHDLNALVCCGQITVNFAINGDHIDGSTFFDRLAQEKRVEVAPALRRLLRAYLNNIKGGEGDMPWHFPGQSLHALRALMLLDPDAHDVFRLYLKKGDLEHDQAPYKLYAEYVDRHGIRNEADLRFGVYVTIMGCLDTEISATGLLDAAARLTTPERFADIVIQEAKNLYPEFWDEHGGDYIKFLAGSPNTSFTRFFTRSPSVSFTRAVIAILESRIS